MTSPGPVYDLYGAGGSEEWLMRIGPGDGPAILFLPPLLEEMNRTRALLASVMRLLGEHGFGCWLPDLPGTGESGRALETCRWEDWQDAVDRLGQRLAGQNGRLPAIASFRGGSLLDRGNKALCQWRFAPAEGASLARDLVRSTLVGATDRHDDVIVLAGYRLAPAMLASLEQARLSDVAPLRTLRLASDRAEADRKFEGPALWRRSEPGNSPELAALLARDLEAWIGECGG